MTANPPNLTPAQVQAMELAAATQLGRFSAPELWFSTTQAVTAANGPQTIANTSPLNLTRPAESITILASFRVTVTVAPYTAVAPEAPQNFIQKIILAGQSNNFGGTQIPISLSGATAYAWGRMFQIEAGGGEYFISKAGGALTRAAQPGRPFTSAFDGTVATHDMIVIINIPFGPSLMPGQAVRKQSTSYLLQPSDWGNTLFLNLIIGDASAFGDPTGATVTFQGFGGTGNPFFAAHVNYALLGDFRNSTQRSGLIIRQEQPTTPNQTALGTTQLLTQLSHQITTSVLLKTGRVQTAGLTGGIDTLASLSDVQMEATQIIVDNTAKRNNSSNFVQKAYLERMFNTVIPEGYYPVTFVDGDNALLAYRGDRLPGGSQCNLVSNVITANAAQRQRVVQEYILGGPFPA